MMGSMKVPHDSFVDSRDFARIAKAIRFIDSHFREQPRLTTIAAQAGLSEFHFNRLFRRWAGVTPKQYLAFVTGSEARGEITGPLLGTGRGLRRRPLRPGRLHDLIVTLDAVTPGELKGLGRGITLHYGFSETPFGEALLATTPRGLCHLAFVETGEREKAVSELRDRWRNADVVRDDARAQEFAIRIWGGAAACGGRAAQPQRRGNQLPAQGLAGAARCGPHGRTTYSALAATIGAEGSARAVGNAVGANPIGWLIPCHNVLRRDGALGGYHWGEDRKRAILAWDSLTPQRKTRADDVSAALQVT